MSDIADSIAKTLREAGVVDRKPTLGEITGAIAVELARIDERLKKLELLRDIIKRCAVHFFEVDGKTERATCKHCGFTVTKQTLVESGYLDYVEQVKKGEGP